jgi:hypothetical protein
VTVDGVEDNTLWLDEAICAIERVEIATAWSDGYTIEPAEYRVYNRHLTQRLTAPDDRDFPQIGYRARSNQYWSIATAATPWIVSSRMSWGGIGRQVVRVKGVFGYTDWDGSPVGRTPLKASWVTMRVALKTLAPAYSGGGLSSVVVSPGGTITSMKTREQSITWDAPKLSAAGSGYDSMARYTGDAAIDSVIEMLCRPIVGAVV